MQPHLLIVLTWWLLASLSPLRGASSGVESPSPVARMPSKFALFLLKDRDLGAADAQKLALGQLVLEAAPLLTEDDILEYRWSDHELKLRPAARERLPGGSVSGVPFVVVAGGQRVYLGAFIAPLSSIAFPAPTIVDDPRTMKIDRSYPASWATGETKVDDGAGHPLVPPDHFTGPDPRVHPAIREALKSVLR